MQRPDQDYSDNIKTPIYRDMHTYVSLLKWGPKSVLLITGFDFDYWCLRPLSSIFQLYHFSGGRSWTTRREPPTMGKQLINVITCG